MVRLNVHKSEEDLAHKGFTPEQMQKIIGAVMANFKTCNISQALVV